MKKVTLNCRRPIHRSVLHSAALKSKDVTTLIEQALEGDQRALSQLCRHVESIAKQRLKNLLRDKHDVKYLVEETVVWFIDNMHIVKNGESLRSFLGAKMMFLTRDHFRVKYKNLIDYYEPSDLENRIAPGVPDHGIEAFEADDESAYQLDQLRSIFEKLPDDARKILEMKYLMGYDYVKISTELRISTENARQKVRRALILLKKIFPILSQLLVLSRLYLWGIRIF